MNKDTGNGGLELLQADCAWYYSGISAPLPVDRKRKVGNNQLTNQTWSSCLGINIRWMFEVHFDITWLLVVAERTGELRVQIPRHLLLRRGLSFGLAATHCTQTESSLRVKRDKKKTTGQLQQGEHVRWLNTSKEKICDNTWLEMNSKQQLLHHNVGDQS